MEALQQQHQHELIQNRAQQFELQRREHELVMILSTLQAVKDQSASAESTPSPETPP